jgi:hypothetical protein
MELAHQNLSKNSCFLLLYPCYLVLQGAIFFCDIPGGPVRISVPLDSSGKELDEILYLAFLLK